MTDERNYWNSLWKTRASRRQVLRGAALGGAGLAAAVVIGCGEEETSTSSPAGGTGAAAGEPKRGGVITWLSQSNETANTLDIHKIGHTTMYRAGMAYNKLIRHDMSKYPEEFAFIGDSLIAVRS